MTITRTGGATALALAVMLGAAATAFGQAAEEMPQGMGPGMIGPGMLGTGAMGQGMAPGMVMGPGVMGPGMSMMGLGIMQPLAKDLTAADVLHMIEHQLAWQRNPNLKAGKVEEKDQDIITAEVVTQEGSLVQRLEVDRHTGLMRVAQ